jgi:hypothetical protein
VGAYSYGLNTPSIINIEGNEWSISFYNIHLIEIERKRKLIVNNIDRLIKEAKALIPSKILFYFSSRCKRCSKHIDDCSCRSKRGDDTLINFVRVTSREEAIKCREEEKT